MVGWMSDDGYVFSEWKLQCRRNSFLASYILVIELHAAVLLCGNICI